MKKMIALSVLVALSGCSNMQFVGDTLKTCNIDRNSKEPMTKEQNECFSFEVGREEARRASKTAQSNAKWWIEANPNVPFAESGWGGMKMYQCEKEAGMVAKDPKNSRKLTYDCNVYMNGAVYELTNLKFD